MESGLGMRQSLGMESGLGMHLASFLSPPPSHRLVLERERVGARQAHRVIICVGVGTYSMCAEVLYMLLYVCEEPPIHVCAELLYVREGTICVCGGSVYVSAEAHAYMHTRHTRRRRNRAVGKLLLQQLLRLSFSSAPELQFSTRALVQHLHNSSVAAGAVAAALTHATRADAATDL
jgi:hypothetical protein